MQELQKLNDEQIVEIITEENKEAFAEIIRRYQEKLFRYATYLLGNSENAVDITQESFIKAYVNLNSFNTNLKFSSWIYRIVHNEAINFINKNKNVKPIFKDLEIESDENLEEEYTKKEIINMTKTCINDMPIMYKEPLTLYYLEDKTYIEISDILRIPTSTVGVRLGRAKALMKKICQRKIK